MSALRLFVRECTRHWLSVLRRRGQRYHMTWLRLRPWIDRLIPPPVILHAYSKDRVYAKPPKYAVILHLRISAGGRPYGRPLP
jgi:hypothetical protein